MLAIGWIAQHKEKVWSAVDGQLVLIDDDRCNAIFQIADIEPFNGDLIDTHGFVHPINECITHDCPFNDMLAAGNVSS